MSAHLQRSSTPASPPGGGAPVSTLDPARDAERARFYSAASRVLPAAFRLGAHVPPLLKKHMTAEMEKFATDAARWLR